VIIGDTICELYPYRIEVGGEANGGWEKEFRPEGKTSVSNAA
jgi:hypothetical protein